jgi:hypothetical protein
MPCGTDQLAILAKQKLDYIVCHNGISLNRIDALQVFQRYTISPTNRNCNLYQIYLLRKSKK